MGQSHNPLEQLEPRRLLATSTIFASATPGTIDAGDPQSVALGVRFRADLTGYITAIRYYKSPANTGAHIANLSGFGSNLDLVQSTNQTYTFGQPTSRAGQVFGSGGPRAFQVGGRVQF